MITCCSYFGEATCKIHKRCVCWIPADKGDPDQLYEGLVEWLSHAEDGEGEDGAVSHLGHADMLKTSYGMKSRNASASSSRLT